jgi:hypothetical protein
MTTPERVAMRWILYLTLGSIALLGALEAWLTLVYGG